MKTYQNREHHEIQVKRERDRERVKERARNVDHIIKINLLTVFLFYVETAFPKQQNLF